jgi:hypothetical protein
MSRPKGMMEFGLFKRIVSEAKALGVERFNLWLMGEPFLNPQVFEFIRFAKENNLKLSLITNGALLKNELADEFLALPLTREDSLLISFLAPNATAFALRKAGALTFQEYKEGVFRFIRRRQEERAKFEVVLMYLVNISSDVVDTPGLITEASGVLGVLDELKEFTRPKIPRASDIERAIKNCQELKIELLPGVYFNLKWLTNWGKAILPEGLKVVPSARGYCSYPFESLGIFWDGRVTLCCDDYNAELVVGDVKESSLSQAFYSEKAEQIRSEMNKGSLLMSRCQLCQGKVTDRQGKVLKSYYKKYYLGRLLRHLKSHGIKKTIKKIFAEV